MLIRWTDQAERDLDSIFNFLIERSPQTALQSLRDIRARVARLSDHPGLGRTGRVASTREFVITGTPYLIAYTVDSTIDAVIILRVLHGSQRWPVQM